MPIGYRNHGAVANCNEALKMDSSCQYPAKIYDATDSRKLIVLGESQAVRKALVGRKLCGYNIVVTERFEYLPSEVLVHFDQRREGVAVGRS